METILRQHPDPVALHNLAALRNRGRIERGHSSLLIHSNSVQDSNPTLELRNEVLGHSAGVCTHVYVKRVGPKPSTQLKSPALQRRLNRSNEPADRVGDCLVCAAILAHSTARFGRSAPDFLFIQILSHCAIHSMEPSCDE